MSLRRVLALVRRHYYLYRSSWPRLLELIYWPVMGLLLWGFLALYIERSGPDLPAVIPTLLGALILWDVLFRSQIGVVMVFLEEVWSRNLASLFVSPLRPLELMTAQVVVGALRTCVAVGSMAILALLLYGFNVFSLGPALVLFFANLIVMGWSIGMFVSGLILRFGQGAESLAWAIIFLFQPIAAVFYPVAVLPAWLQPVSWSTPAANVFEGMRTVIIEGRIDWDLLACAAGLNVIYLIVGGGFFLWMFRLARRDGVLLQIGE
jgi:ABC-2 type transport system permease protein